MATQNSSSTSVWRIVQRYFSFATASSALDIFEVSRSVYPDTHYTDNEKVEINSWIITSEQLTRLDEDQAKHAERLGSLNLYLSTRTTLLGSKPSIADGVVYARLSPAVKIWTDEERTGERGYHHVVRYVDFVQNSPLFGLAIPQNEKVTIDPNDVLFVHKPLDPKEEKERKRKEKAFTAALNGESQISFAVGQSRPQEGVESKKENSDTQLSATKENVAGAARDRQANQPRKEKKEKVSKQSKTPAKDIVLSPCLIDLRVGHIIQAVPHPNADSLYVSTIVCGDPPGTENTSEFNGQVVRTVCSGLNGLIPLSEMQDRKIIAVCNLKPVTMRGVKSAAMVLAASPRLAPGTVDNHVGPVELVNPPAGAKAGERVHFEGWEGEPEGVLNPKKKVWETIQPGFTTTEDLGVAFDAGAVEQLKAEGRKGLGKLVVVSGGECKVTTLKGAVVR
ncbi:G4 quadruplex nucleic acid binding protein [Xylographa opegraphella]|nr:G4 quadruplex nucleic acid binding protein [Xylographa opegraphella]